MRATLAKKWVGVAVFTLAALSACGGGGGGSTTPGLPTATATPTMTPGAGQVASGSVTVGAAAQTLTLSNIGLIASNAITVPAAYGGSGSITLALSSSLPSGAPTLAATMRKLPRAIGAPLSPIAYVVVTPSAALSFASTLSFSFSLISGTSLASGASAYIGIYDPTQPALNWTTYLGPGVVSGQTISFAAAAQSVTLQANVPYVFALFSTAQVITPPSPSPSPSPFASATTFANGGLLIANFTTNFPVAARSAVFTFTPQGSSGTSTVVPIPSGCSASPPCSVTLNAPAGPNQALQVLLYASMNGGGTALAVGSGTATIPANQTTTYSFALNGIMATFTIGLSPSTVTVGQSTQILVTKNAFDAADEPLAAGYVTTNLTAPNFTLSITDPTGTSSTGLPTPPPYSYPPYGGNPYYSGIGSGPISFTAQTPSYPPASASLTFTAAAAFTIGYALDSGGPASAGTFLCTVGVYARAGTTPLRTYVVPCTFNSGETWTPGDAHFDRNGTLWGVAPVGINPDGTSAGTFAPAGALLAFDVNGNAYVSDPGTNALDVYNGTTQIRQIDIPGKVSGAAADASGNIYVSFQQAGSPSIINEYGPNGGGGTITPIATNSNSLRAPVTDSAGNLYALTNSLTVGVWLAGTFGSGAPGQTIAGQSCCVPSFSASPQPSFAVDAAGDVYASGTITTQGFPPSAPTVVPMYAAAGSGTFVQFSPSTFIPGSVTFLNESPNVFAAPLR